MRINFQGLTRLMLPVVAGAGCMIAMLSTMTAVAEWKDMMPRVGDMITFTPSNDAPFLDTARLRVRTAAASACTLDLRTLRHNGGSFVIGRWSADDAVFTVHWAGERTADAAENCGGDDDLLLQKEQLSELGAAANREGLAPQIVTGSDGNL